MSLRPYWNGGPCDPEGRLDWKGGPIGKSQKRSTKFLSKAFQKKVNEKAGSVRRPLVGGPYCSLEAPSKGGPLRGRPPRTFGGPSKEGPQELWDPNGISKVPPMPLLSSGDVFFKSRRVWVEFFSFTSLFAHPPATTGSPALDSGKHEFQIDLY